MANLGQAYVQIVPSAEGLAGSISKALGGEAEDAGKGAGLKITGAIKKLIIGAGLGTALKAALDEGAKLQQSFGGLDTLYGDASAAAKEYAAAASAAGISANDYAEQAVSFGASLKQAFGGDTTKSVEAANTAIMDMADNAAKMGTPIEQIQSAYQGFAKGQYQLLDNLKLGYGGTKEEMQRLLKDAQAITGVEYDINNLGDVYDAIHVIQGELGLTGVAADEAATTFSGSLGAMKAAAQNILGNLALGEDIRPSLEALATSAYNFVIGNLFPMVGNVIKGVGPIIGEGLKMAFDSLPGLAQMATDLLNRLADSLTASDGVLKNGFTQVATSAINAFKSIDWLGLGSAVLRLVLAGIQTIGPIMWQGLKAIGATGLTIFRSIDWLGLGRQVLTFVINGIKAIGSNVGSTLKSIGTTALNNFKSISWVGVGRDVINGIVRGVSNAAGSLYNSLKNIAKNALQAAKDFLKIGSPSRLFAQEVGQWIPPGIAEGAEQAAGVLDDAMRDIALDALGAVDGFTIGQAAAPASTPSSGAVIYNTFNITAPAGMDVRELADQVVMRMTMAERQRAAVWGTV